MDDFVEAMDVSKNPETKDLRITFQAASGATHQAFLDQAMAAWLFAALAEKIEQSGIVPISRHLLSPGTVMEVAGVQIRPQIDNLLVTLLARVDGRQVSVPFNLSFDQVRDLVAAARRAGEKIT